jgi:Excinuclease ATPase subunit
MRPARLSVGRFNPRSSLIAAITGVQELLKHLYAASGNQMNSGQSWSAEDFTELKNNKECPLCNGNKTAVDIDPRRMIAPELSLKHGAVLLWAGTNCGPVEMIKQLAQALGIDYNRPLAEQDPAFIDILLYGYEKEPLTYTHRSNPKHGFYRGCMNDVKYLRDSGTTSKGNLRAIDYFSGPVHCPVCSQSSHYHTESLSVTVCGLTIRETAVLSINELILFVRQLKQSWGQGELMAVHEIIEDIEARLSFLHKLGLKNLSPVYCAEKMA